MKRITNYPTAIVAVAIVLGLTAVAIVGFIHGGDQFTQLVLGLTAGGGITGTLGLAAMKALREPAPEPPPAPTAAIRESAGE